MKTAIERLADAVGYPERVPEGALSFTFRVDGAELRAEESDGRVVLTCLLTDAEALVPTLAQYAAGRMLKEEAVLSYGQPGPSAFLWQEASAEADARGLLRLFESFANSCDWWRERVDALRGGGAQRSDGAEMMMIRP